MAAKSVVALRVARTPKTTSPAPGPHEFIFESGCRCPKLGGLVLGC